MRDAHPSKLVILRSPDGAVRGTVAALALAVAAPAFAVAAPTEPCRTVHGRMSLGTGAPTVRIAVTGTRRVLGVVQPNERFDDLPPIVRAIWSGKDPDADWATAIDGDFKVCPMAQARAARMQAVRLVEAAHLTARPRR